MIIIPVLQCLVNHLFPITWKEQRQQTCDDKTNIIFKLQNIHSFLVYHIVVGEWPTMRFSRMY